MGGKTLIIEREVKVSRSKGNKGRFFGASEAERGYEANLTPYRGWKGANYEVREKVKKRQVIRGAREASWTLVKHRNTI